MTGPPAADAGRHIVFPTNIQTHLTQQRPDRGDSQERFELSLKAAAIITRGVVVSDSDLNNNPLLHGQMDEGCGLRTAVEIGFVRRAVRAGADGSATSQSQVLEELVTNNPERADRVSREHVRQLDLAFERAESSGRSRPLLWTFPQLATLFAERLVKVLDDGRADTAREPAARSLYVRTSDRVRAELAADRPIRAAGLERELTGRMSDTERAAWPRVFDDVLAAYNGNVPVALDLTLTDPVADPTPFLPSGPDSAGDELDRELELYRNVTDGSPRGFEIVPTRIPIPEDLERLEIDYELLARTDVRDLVELREEADPTEFFDSRHRSLGSGNLLSDELPTLLETGTGFVQRFTRAALARGPGDLRHLVRERLRPSTGAITGYSLAFEDEDRLVEMMMGFLSPESTWLSSQIAHCDLDRVRKLAPELDRQVPHLAQYASFTIQRPDYRVIRRVSEALLR